MSPATPEIQMAEFLDLRPDINVSETEYKRLLGFPPDYIFAGRVRELAEWARKWFAENGHPWVYGRQTDFELANEQLRVNGTVLNSKRLHDQLLDAHAREAMLVIVSAGRECEEKAQQLWREGKPDEYFFLEVFGSAVVEHLITTAGARLCAWAEQNRMAVLPHYSPGYSGWDVADQSALFGLIAKTQEHSFPQEVRVFDSGMLQPKKSLLAIFGYTRSPEKLRIRPGLVPCENCSFSPCQYRRVPYRHSMPPLEDVSRLQPQRQSAVLMDGSNSGLNLNGKYSINHRALRKWSQDRLHLRVLTDGSIEAQFRYEGTTCSNLGRAIECDYIIKLAPRHTGYRIIEVNCAPTARDTGFQQMCEYLSNATGLTASMAAEKPLLGRPLDNVLTWDRVYSPAGCYCDADSRNHKWGLVLEVIHYALAQHEKQMANSGEDHPAETSN